MKSKKETHRKETVYDRCAYIGCYNGKYTNGQRLFHFPAETDRRLEMWIERSGNFRLRTWAATSLRKAGLCGDHFDEKSFTNSSRKALRRNVVPRHYTEDLKHRNLIQDNSKINEKTGIGEITNNCLEDCERLSSSTFETVDVNGDVANANNAFDESSSQSGEYQNECVEATRKKSPSPVVEYIVEELDENLIRESVQVSEFPGEEETETDNDERIRSSIMKYDHEISDDETDLRSQFSDEPESFKLGDKDGSSRNENGYENEIYSNDSQDAPRPQFHSENSDIHNTSRVLKQNLRGSDERDVDEFLNAQKCTNPFNRAMIKLLLHNAETPYSNEEKECATRLYKVSPETLDRLKDFGCDFPSENRIKRWLSREIENQSNDRYSVISESTNNAHGIDEDTNECDEILIENSLADNEINYIPELSSGIAENVESIEGLDEQIDDSEMHHEYMEVSSRNDEN